jgi:hypothetical protein
MGTVGSGVNSVSEVGRWLSGLIRTEESLRTANCLFVACCVDDFGCLLDDCDVRDEDNPLLAGGNGLIGGKL